MVIQSIREFNRAAPFVPYEIRMASGEGHRVPHHDFVLLSPRGHYVIVVDEKERPHPLNAILIESAVPLNGQRPRKGKNRTQ